ncbi:type II secretion system protein [Domibacillus enclensis]|nr:type II secretion system protein [Domibacillus enclensis]
MNTNEKGYTLIELLAVVVILGIISAIAVVGIGQLINQSKERAFVSQALHLKEAANLLITSERVKNPDSIPSKVTYETLLQEGFLEKIKDPFTGNFIEPNSETTVSAQNGRITKVCLHGEEYLLCEAPSDLKTENIQPK